LGQNDPDVTERDVLMLILSQWNGILRAEYVMQQAMDNEIVQRVSESNYLGEQQTVNCSHNINNK
jgi:hypothetical protein